MTLVADAVARGERVVLRRKRLSDVERDYRWRSDPELAAFDATQPLRSSYADFSALYREELEYPGPFRHILALEDAHGKHIGNTMYYNLDERRGEAELGITIGDRAYWGQGYGTDAVRTLVHYLFQTTPLQRIYLHTLEWNQRAQRCFQKAGFVACGRRRRNGHDFVVMEIRHQDWQRSGTHPAPRGPADRQGTEPGR